MSTLHCKTKSPLSVHKLPHGLYTARQIKSQRDVSMVGLRLQPDVSGDYVWRQIVGLLRVLVNIAAVQLGNVRPIEAV